MAKRSKKYQEAAKLIDRTKRYSLEEACELVKKTSTSKFDATVECAVRLNIDPRKAEQNLRGAVSLPHGTGKSVRVLVVTKGAKIEEAKAAGADYVGDKDMLEKIQKENWFDFDIIVATPDMMGELGKMGRLLGPKGLMPNPKTGTVSMDIAKAITEIKAGKIEYRVDKQGNIHLSIGRVSFDTAKLVDNLNVVVETLLKVRPASVKGQYVKNCVVTTTMGPSVKFTFNGR